MANDNLLTIVMEQKQGDRTFSRLTLEYPDIETVTEANVINMGYVEALVARANEFVAGKAEQLGETDKLPPGQAKK